MKRRIPLFVLAAALVPGATFAQAKFDGYLCCNMRTDGSWISDGNYAEGHKLTIAAGTPVKVTGYGRYRVRVEVDGSRQAIGNDYSRDLDLETFARRYVVTEDPTARLAGYPEPIRAAIAASRIAPGMTREQVLMSQGYPMSSENPDLSASLWRYWRSSFAEYQVLFDEQGRVREVSTDPQTRNLVWQP